LIGNPENIPNEIVPVGKRGLYSCLYRTTFIKNPAASRGRAAIFLLFVSVLANLISPAQVSDSAWKHAAAVGADSSFLCPGEELVYEVSWFYIRLGQIRVKTLEPVKTSRNRSHGAEAFIDSYSGLPFVDLHAIDRTEMDDKFYSLGYRSLEKKDEMWYSEVSHYNLAESTVVIEKSYQKEKNSEPAGPSAFDTLKVNEYPIQDGFSILFFARANLKSRSDLTVPTIVYGKMGRTVFHFKGGTEYAEIDALEDQKVRVVPLEGRAEFKGLLGLSGEFKGWFSDDSAAVPIRAEMKVLIGSVKIELIKWNRPGWNPPALRN